MAPAGMAFTVMHSRCMYLEPQLLHKILLESLQGRFGSVHRICLNIFALHILGSLYRTMQDLEMKSLVGLSVWIILVFV